jgi:hypothetical protein
VIGGGEMSIFEKIFRIGEKPGTYSYKLKRAKELHGQVIKYVTERNDGNEDIIGRGGALAIHEDKFIVDSSGDRIFVCYIKDLDASWLMSGNGAVISGPNLLEDGKKRTITVHFVYHRK